MTDTLFPIPKELFRTLRKANSEATVRKLVIQQLNYDDITLEEGRTDVYHKNVLFEFKLVAATASRRFSKKRVQYSAC